MKRSEEESRKVLTLQRIPAVEKGWETDLLNMASEWWSEQMAWVMIMPDEL